MYKIAVDHYTHSGLTFSCECDDGQDQTVMQLEMMDYLCADQEGMITLTEQYRDMDDDVAHRYQQVTFADWMSHTPKDFICEVLAAIINARESRTTTAPGPDYKPAALPDLQKLISDLLKPAA